MLAGVRRAPGVQDAAIEIDVAEPYAAEARILEDRTGVRVRPRANDYELAFPARRLGVLPLAIGLPPTWPSNGRRIPTEQPTDEFQGFADVSYNEGNEVVARAGVSGPLEKGKVDGLVSVYFGDYDGNVHNVYLNQTVNGYGRYGTRSKLAFTPSNDFKLVLSVDYLYTRSTEVSTFISTDTSYPGGVITHAPSYVALLAPVVAIRRTRTRTPTSRPMLSTTISASRHRPITTFPITR